jgi:hypothetical protein
MTDLQTELETALDRETELALRVKRLAAALYGAADYIQDDSNPDSVKYADELRAVAKR